MNPPKGEPWPFQAYDVSLALVRSLRESLVKIAQHDRNLADQIRRAAASVPLNLREGRGRVGRDRLHLWRVAAGSAEELVAAAQVAEAFGYIDDGELADAVDLANRVLAMCWRLTHRRTRTDSGSMRSPSGLLQRTAATRSLASS